MNVMPISFAAQRHQTPQKTPHRTLRKPIRQSLNQERVEDQYRLAGQKAGGWLAFHFLGKNHDLGKPLATYFTTRIFTKLRNGAKEITLTPTHDWVKAAQTQFGFASPASFKMVIKPTRITIQSHSGQMWEFYNANHSS